MSLPQQKFREIVFQMLYSIDMGQASEEAMLPLLMAELAVTKQSVRKGQERVRLIIQKQAEIDAWIAKYSLSYTFERIQSVERNILRLGVFELLYDKEIPPKVAIAEALRLARKFGTPEAATFVNAILDSIYKGMIGEKIDETDLAQASKQLMHSEDVAYEASQEPQEKTEC